MKRGGGGARKASSFNISSGVAGIEQLNELPAGTRITGVRNASGPYAGNEVTIEKVTEARTLYGLGGMSSTSQNAVWKLNGETRTAADIAKILRRRSKYYTVD